MARKTVWQVRQGDILIERVDESAIPAAATVLPRDGAGRVVLALGEVTGHAHALLEPAVELLTTSTADAAERWLRVRSAVGAALVHEEHATITLPPGTFRITRQREYSPAAIRTVAD